MTLAYLFVQRASELAVGALDFTEVFDIDAGFGIAANLEGFLILKRRARDLDILAVGFKRHGGIV
jgi:hypothetical protein